MKKLLIIICILFPLVCHAAKVTDFTDESSPASADLLWLTVDVSTEPADRKLTLGNLLLWMATQDWTFSGTVTLPVITLADASTLTLPAAAPTAEGLPITCNNSDSTCSFATGFSSITIGCVTASTVAASYGSVHLGSLSTQNMLTTGTVSGKVPMITKSDSYTLGTDSAQEAYGYMVFMSGDGKILTLPAVVAGMSVCVYSTDATAKVVAPNASDGIRNGTAARNADGHTITSDAGAGSFVCLIADSADGWTVLGKAGTWTDE